MSASPGEHQPELGQFEVVSRLGAGGMAEVFLAKKRGAEGTYKLLVVKRILPSFGASRRFRTMFVEEAQLATRLNHPNVVQVYEFFDAGPEGHILSMEYIEGPTLGQLLGAARRKQETLGPWTAAFLVQEAAKGLHYAHEKCDERGEPLDIVHRDVSPQNVLLSYDGIVKITDFGIASARDIADEEGVIKGKYGYMSPEQARGERVDRRSDLYSLGVIFWEALTGRALHGNLSGQALLETVRRGRVDAPSMYAAGIPLELEAVALKLLAEDPAERYVTGREVASVIARAMMVKQELVDSTVLEGRIAYFVDANVRRELAGIALASGGSAEGSAADAHTQAAIRAAMGGKSRAGDSQASQIAILPRPPSMPLRGIPLNTLQPAASSGEVEPIEAREVRHVVVATLRLSARESVPSSERVAYKRGIETVQRMLGEMAYKRGMRWVWLTDHSARAVAGLAPKHARAPQEAAQLALDTHEAIAGYADAFPVPVAASVSLVRGIASGTRDTEGNLVRCALHEPVDYLADVVEQATPIGKTWVAGGLYRLIWRDFVWHEALEVKLNASSQVGLPAAMQLYELERRKSKLELDAVEEQHGAELVGRDVEKADLHAAFHTSLNGQPGGLLTTRVVIGELGIGKTTLVGGFLNELPEGVRVLHVECTPVNREVPFFLVAELVRAAAGVTGDEPFEEIARRLASIGGGAASGDSTHPLVARLAELAGNRKKVLDDDDSDLRRQILVGLRTIFAAIAIETPLVIATDGLHWADRQSLDLLVEITHAPDPLPILLLAITRPDERVAALIDRQVRIQLDALSFDEQVRLLELRLRARDGVRAVCTEIVAKVGGNPFFLLEMVDALLERGVLELDYEVLPDGGLQGTLIRHGHDEDGLVLPSTLEQLLADRIVDLPQFERLVLDWLAVAGGPLHLGELQALAPQADDAALANLLTRGLCDRRQDLIDFRHPLLRDVAYSSMDADARTRMHAALARHLLSTSVARGLAAAVVARHFIRGNEPQPAIALYMEAADSARVSHQTSLARKYFKRALALMSHDDGRREIAADNLENLYRLSGRRVERLRMLVLLRKLAKRSESPRAACVALVRTARFYLDDGRLTEARAATEQAARVARERSLVLLSIEAEALLGEIAGELGDVQGALAACDRALATCDPKLNHGVPARTHADVLRARGVLLRRLGRVREAVDSYAEAIALCKQTNARRLEARTRNSLAYAMFVQGSYEDAVALALQAIQIDLSIGGRFQLAKTLTNIGHSYARLGDFVRAHAYLDRAREAHVRYGDSDGHADTLLVCGEVALELGDVKKAAAYLDEAMPIIVASKNGYDGTHAALVRAAIALASGEPERAALLAVEARRMAEPQALVAYSFYGVALEAAARAECGEVHTATLLATTGFGAVETLQGCEYGLEIRLLCAKVLKQAASPQAAHAQRVTLLYAEQLLAQVRDQRFRKMFISRPALAGLFDSTSAPILSTPTLVR